MATLPAAGRPGIFDPRNPTLVPNFDLPYAENGTVGLQSPALFLKNNPRTDATAEATIGGTITAGNTVTLTVTHGLLPGGSLSVTYTVLSTDTVDTIAEALAGLINDSAAAQGANLRADSAAAVVTLRWNGPVGNFAVLSESTSGGATETVTLTPSNGVFSGGAGPVFASNNFTFGYNGVLKDYWYGQPYILPETLIGQMVAAGEPLA